MNLTVPFSKWGSSTSCWALLKRCSSSTNSTVLRPCMLIRICAWAMRSRISATLDSTPLSIMKWAFVVRAMTEASVVLPQPGGP